MVPGPQLGIQFPPNIEPLREAGTQFLTAAFRAAGVLDSDNSVTGITRFEEFFGGGAGRKLLLCVQYAKPQPGLHTDLFVKYPRDFGDPLRELFSHLMEPETRFALLSRRPGFPLAVPECYFADYDPQTRSGILITERIDFGRNGIEPFYDKCLDYELAAPLEHYSALIRVIARLAGAHKSGRFGAEIDQQFPYDPKRIRPHDLIPYTPDQLQQKIENLGRFSDRYPQLLSPRVASAPFLTRLATQAQGYLRHELAIKRFLNSRAEFVALCHWNANIDNAWFWRNASGELQAGLLDWGSVSQMNVAQSIFGALCAVEIDFWNAHCDHLILVFAEEYRRCGGPVLPVPELKFHVQLFVAMLGLAWLIDAPAIIEANLQGLDAIESRFDPGFRSNFLARAQLQLLVVLLNAWQTEDYGAVLDRFLALKAA